MKYVNSTFMLIMAAASLCACTAATDPTDEAATQEGSSPEDPGAKPLGGAPQAELGPGSSYLNKGERLYRGQSIRTETTNYSTAVFIMQDDGNLVLYTYPYGGGRRACWASNTDGRGGVFVEYQHDGNLVIYNGDYRPVWASNTQGSSGDNTNINLYGQVWVGYTALTGYCAGV